MARNFAAILIGICIGALFGVFMRMRAKRRHADEIRKHPERLEEMLDPTDDA